MRDEPIGQDLVLETVSSIPNLQASPSKTSFPRRL